MKVSWVASSASARDISFAWQSALVPEIKDPTLREQIANQIMRASVPHGNNEHHYAQARGTDAALVHVHNERNFPGVFYNQHDYLEKFLFYRGVGSFELPIDVAFKNDHPYFTNHGQQPIRSAIMIESKEDKLFATKIDSVDVGQSIRFFDPEPISAKGLYDMVVQSLIDEGLYKKEAISMVNTWNNSWFREPGRRVLYMVPGQITDELLPLLHIKPSPQEQLRVLVGRMEIMSPTDERELTEMVRKNMMARKAFLEKQKEQKNRPAFPFPQEVRKWGRMTEPALVRVSKIAPLDVQNEAKPLLLAMRNEPRN